MNCENVRKALPRGAKQFVREFRTAFLDSAGQHQGAHQAAEQRYRFFPRLLCVSVHSSREYLKIRLNSVGKRRLNLFAIAGSIGW